MATTMSHAELAIPGDDMEVSSDIGRPADDNFDIDIDFDENDHNVRDEDSMMDDTLEPNVDDLMHDGTLNDGEDKDGIMLDGDTAVDEDIPDATGEGHEYPLHDQSELALNETSGAPAFTSNTTIGLSQTPTTLPPSVEVQARHPEGETSHEDQSYAEHNDDFGSADILNSVDISKPGAEADEFTLFDHEQHDTSDSISKGERVVRGQVHADESVDVVEGSKGGNVLHETSNESEQPEHEAGFTETRNDSRTNGAEQNAQTDSNDKSTEKDNVGLVIDGNEEEEYPEKDSEHAQQTSATDTVSEEEDNLDEQEYELDDEASEEGDQGVDSHQNTTNIGKASEGQAHQAFPDEESLPAGAGLNIDKLCPAILTFDGAEMYLFPSDETAGLHSPILEDSALAYGPINDLIRACRTSLAPASREHDYLIFDIPDLQLHITETSPEATHTSLQNILEVHSQLCWNDSHGEIPALRITTLLRSDCTTRISELESVIAQGKGYDHLFPTDDDEDSSEEQEEGIAGTRNGNPVHEEHDESGTNSEESQDENETNEAEKPPHEDHGQGTLEGQGAPFDDDQQEIDFAAAEDYHNDADDFGRDDFAAFEEPSFEEQQFDNLGDDLGEFGDLVDHVEDDLEAAAPDPADNLGDPPASAITGSRKRSLDDAHSPSEDANNQHEAKKSRPS